MKNLKMVIYSYNITITFTLLAVLNLTSWWGSFSYRMIMVLMNIVVGASMEYLVNRFASLKNFHLFKVIIALVLLLINIVWIVVVVL